MSHYEVRGQRAYLDITGVRKITPESHLRFESIAQHEAEQFATNVYRHENIICDIFEIDRVTL